MTLPTYTADPVLEPFISKRGARRRTLIEDVNKKKMDGAAIGLGRAGLKAGPQWDMKRKMMSPRCTTHWDELPLVKA